MERKLDVRGRPQSPPVKRGDYFRQIIRKIAVTTRDGPTRLRQHLPWYPLPPSAGHAGRCHDGFDRGTVFGPVHAFEKTQRFTSVLVPTPHRAFVEDHVPVLVWVNVWTYERDRGTTFCSKVLDASIARWRRAGWQDWYLD